jgi:histidinol-phosphate aminotransferase
MQSYAINTQEVFQTALPEPAPALADLYRVREAGSETRAYVGLDRNERLRPLPGWFMKKIREAVESDLLTRYPVQDTLLSQLAKVMELPEERLLLTHGSDAAVKAIYQAYFRPRDRVVVLEPSYAMYTVYAQMFQAEVVKNLFDRSLKLDAKLLVNGIVPGVRLVLVANPNQPTGTLLDERTIVEVIERAARVRALVAIDEAYYPFSHVTAMPLLEAYPNLLILRTFSKAAGLAGLRLGFVAGHAEVIRNLFKVRTANDLNAVAIQCASLILSHPQVVDEYVAEVEAGGHLLAARVRSLGLTPLPTYANFMLIRVGRQCSPAHLIDSLRSRGYLVKGPFNYPCLQDCIRVTLGPPELMSRFADCLQEVLS